MTTARTTNYLKGTPKRLPATIGTDDPVHRKLPAGSVGFRCSPKQTRLLAVAFDDAAAALYHSNSSLSEFAAGLHFAFGDDEGGGEPYMTDDQGRWIFACPPATYRMANALLAAIAAGEVE